MLWFLAGKQFLTEKRPDAAIGWQCVAVLILLIVSAWAVMEKEWLGFAVGMAVLLIEVRSIKRMSARTDP